MGFGGWKLLHQAESISSWLGADGNHYVKDQSQNSIPHLPHAEQKKEWKEVDYGGVSLTGFSILPSFLIKYKHETSSERRSTNPISTCLWCSDGDCTCQEGSCLPVSLRKWRHRQLMRKTKLYWLSQFLFLFSSPNLYSLLLRDPINFSAPWIDYPYHVAHYERWRVHLRNTVWLPTMLQAFSESWRVKDEKYTH